MPSVTGRAPDLSPILKALRFAAIRHRDQRRRDRHGSPYIIHPIDLACVLALEGGVNDEATLVAALLHDTIEATRTTMREIERSFGAEVAAIVAEVTDDWRLPRVERKRLQIENAASLSRKAQLVRLADKISNVRDIFAGSPVSWDEKRKRHYIDESRQVVDRLRGVNPALERVFDGLYRQSAAEAASAIHGSTECAVDSELPSKRRLPA